MAADPKAEQRPTLSVAASPRAAGSVRRAKSWGGLVGFGLVFLLSTRQGMPYADAGLRALVGGIVGFMTAWAGSVTVWRHLLRAQASAAARAAAAARKEREKERQRRAAAARESES